MKKLFSSKSKARLFIYIGVGVFILLIIGIGMLYRFSHRKSPTLSQDMTIFEPYIAAYTSGVVSSGSTVQVMFTSDVVPQDEVGSEASSSLMSFSPRIKGEAHWINARTLEFAPKEPLQSDEQYVVTVRLDKIFDDVPDQAEEFSFTFRVIRQSVDIVTAYYYANSTADPFNQSIRGELQTADNSTPELLQKYLRCTGPNGEKIEQVIVKDNGSARNFFYEVGPLGSTAGDYTLEFDRQGLGLKGEMKRTVNVPSADPFCPFVAYVDERNEQTIRIIFSQPLRKQQNLDGLFNSEGMVDLRYKIDGNCVILQPSNKLKGEYQLTVSSGVRAASGAVFDRVATFVLKFSGNDPEVHFVQSGAILPLSGQVLLPIYAVGLRAVDVTIYKIYESNMLYSYQMMHESYESSVEINRVGTLVARKTLPLNETVSTGSGNIYALDLSPLIDQEPGVIYRVGLSMRKELSIFSNEPLSEVSLKPGNYEEMGYYDKYMTSFWDYEWSERNDPQTRSYYTYRGFEWRDLQISNLGIIAKRSQSNTIHCFTTSLTLSKPVSGVQVKLYSYQLQEIAEGKTNNDGLAILNYDADCDPFIIVAEQGKDRSYLLVKDSYQLSYSTFDCGGAGGDQGLLGFLYGERGVWRPGDSIFMTLVVEDRLKQLPKSHPIEFKLINSRAQVVDRKVVLGNETGVYAFRTRTDAEDETGYYSVQARIGSVEFRKSIRVETVKPNRLKIDLSFKSGYLSASTDETGRLSSMWLHGAPARNLEASVDAIFTTQHVPFKNYEDFIFSDRASTFYSTERTIFDGALNSEGIAYFSANLSDIKPDGRVKVLFRSRVFEPGGGYSLNMSESVFSPYGRYVGMKEPESDRYYIETDCDQKFKVVSLDSDGKPQSGVSLYAMVYKLDWGWWWEHDSNSLASYVSSRSNKLVFPVQEATTNSKGEASFTFRIDYPQWGRYLVRIVDKVTGHACSEVVYWDWPDSRERSSDRFGSDSKVLTFQADKKKYAVGDKVHLTVPTAEGGSILVSLENGESVLQSFWVEAARGSTDVSFTATPEMAPNVYANLTLIQPYGQTANDLPLRLYGAIPIFVENPDSHLSPVIKAPEEIRPDQKFTVDLREANGRPMTVTLALVDDGLLDLTNFKTPNPWNFFYQKRSLGVSSFDFFDNVMGAYAGQIAGVLSIGGGEDTSPDGSKPRANRFEPVVRFIGPVSLGRGEKRKFEIAMPNYVGSVRLMAVASKDGAYGSSEFTMAVRNPLMVQPTLPRVLAPGDEVSLPISVFAMDDKIKNVTVKIECNDLLVPMGEVKQTITFQKQGDIVVSFPMRTASKVGIAKVKVLAEGNGEKAEATIELDVRNPNPIVSRAKSLMVKQGKSDRAEYSPYAPGSNAKGQVEVSKMPSMGFGHLLSFMTDYPHSCLEHQTSRAFVQMLYPEVVELKKDTIKKFSQLVQDFLGRVSKFQLPNGGFTLWPGYSVPDYWVTSYVGHFLTEAKSRGYTVSNQMLSKWKRYQKEQVSAWNPERARDNSPLQQAYRLYTLARAGSASLGAMNRLKESKDLSAETLGRLAAAYAEAGNMKVAKSLLERANQLTASESDYHYSYGSTLRNQAMLLESLVTVKDFDNAMTVAQTISAKLETASWFSTQEVGFCMLAGAKFAKATNATNEALNGKFIIDGKEFKVGGDACAYTIPFDPVSSGTGKVQFENKGKGTAFVTLTTSGVSQEPELQSSSNNLELQVDYFDANNQPISINRLEQGTDFFVRIRVTNPGLKGDLSQLALYFGLPSGWEVKNERIEGENKHRSDNSYYQDFRDDRVYTYFDLNSHQTKTFYFEVSASYCGKFILPPASCSALYNAAVSASGPGGSVEVTR